MRREHQEVSEYERQYQNGADPRVLDIMDVPLLKAQPHECQQENWLLDPKQYWVKTGSAAWDDLSQLADPVGPLWINGHHTYNGHNDQVPFTQAKTLRSSLRLVAVTGITVAVFAPGEMFGNGKRRVQGCFRYHGAEYRLWITDPLYEREYLAKQNGNYGDRREFPHGGVWVSRSTTRATSSSRRLSSVQNARHEQSPS